MFKEYHYFDCVKSTNSTALDYPVYDVVYAGEQTAGRGRLGRKWLSQKGNLFMSVILPLCENAPFYSLMASVAVADALKQFHPTLKWPNDVLIDGKKVCGILLEGQVPEYLVIGVGLNVNQKRFPEGLRRPATSLSLELNEDINLDELKERLFKSIVNNFSNLKIEDYLEYFRSHNYLQNKRVRVLINNEPFIGEVVGIDDNFCLQILSRDMLLHIDSGEIEIL